MKLGLFLCAVTAFAVQDTTPPVMSLTLPDHPDLSKDRAFDGTPVEEQHKLNKAFSDSEHGSNRYQGFYRDGSTAYCEVGDDAADRTRCPFPKCKIYDHHDGYMKYDAASGAYVKAAANGADSKCKETYMLIEDDNVQLGTNHIESEIHPQLRSEWLIRFQAEDLTGNQAENMTFTMVFRDTMAPELTTEFGKSYLWREINHTDTKYVDHSSAGYEWLESCSGTQVGSYPCVQYLKLDADSAIDKYDGNVDANTQVQLKNPSGTVLFDKKFSELKGDGTNKDVSGTKQNKELAINTQILGNWTLTFTACDNALSFGHGQQSNCGKQVVTLHVEDTTAPIIHLNAPPTSDDVSSSNSSETPIYDASSLSGASTKTDFTCSDAEQKICDVECVWNSNYDGTSTTTNCGAYDEPNAQCRDTRDDFDVTNANSFYPVGSYVHDTLASKSYDTANMCKDSMTIHTTDAANVHKITYSCTDLATPTNNVATNVVRTVTVQDRLPPTISLLGDTQIQISAGAAKVVKRHYIQNSMGVYNSHANVSKFESDAAGGLLDLGMLVATGQGVDCSDLCTTSANLKITKKLFHGKHCDVNDGLVAATDGYSAPGAVDNFPQYEAGDYSILYTCHDGTGTLTKNDTVYQNLNDRQSLTASKCRYIDNVDHSKPIIQVLGSQIMTLEASHAGNYVDDGATCYDQVDGVISQNVEVSGDVVNLSKVGTYEIVYNCKDSAGNVADEAMRTVHIAQTSCPTCQVTGCGSQDVVSYSCKMDHEASFDYTDAGATCSDQIDGAVNYTVSNPVNVELTGEYIVTYRARNSVGLWSDGDKCKGGAKQYKRTVRIVDTLKPVLQVEYQGVKVSKGVATDKAVHDKTDAGLNPANDHTFMVEERSNAAPWMMGALASAIAGVALLASSKRGHAQVSVPV